MGVDVLPACDGCGRRGRRPAAWWRGTLLGGELRVWLCRECRHRIERSDRDGTVEAVRTAVRKAVVERLFGGTK